MLVGAKKKNISLIHGQTDVETAVRQTAENRATVPESRRSRHAWRTAVMDVGCVSEEKKFLCGFSSSADAAAKQGLSMTAVSKNPGRNFVRGFC